MARRHIMVWAYVLVGLLLRAVVLLAVMGAFAATGATAGTALAGATRTDAVKLYKVRDLSSKVSPEPSPKPSRNLVLRPSPRLSPSLSPGARTSPAPLSPLPDPGGEAECASTALDPLADLPWPQLRLVTGEAWRHTQGEGVVVAVVGSGVEEVPQLSGRVLPGIDLTVKLDQTDDSGIPGQAGADCLDHGTAVASIIAASRQEGTGLVGMAPAATILPVRVATATGTETAAAVEAAIVAGAMVAAVPVPYDLGDPALSAALDLAARHDVVVVMAAPEQTGPAPATASDHPRPEGVLRVGASAPNDAIATTYRPGTVDVLAPGTAIAGLGVEDSDYTPGSGTDYAVASVAGLAALVRAADPELTAAQVAHWIRTTADPLATSVPDQTYGWGVINPRGAVTAALHTHQPDRSVPSGVTPARQPPGPAGASPAAIAMAATTLVAALTLSGMLALRTRLLVGRFPVMRGRSRPLAAHLRHPHLRQLFSESLVLPETLTNRAARKGPLSRPPW